MDEHENEHGAARGAALVLGLHYVACYKAAGCPFGPTVEAMLLWMRYGCKARAN